jgi:hypothetical protein
MSDSPTVPPSPDPPPQYEPPRVEDLDPDETAATSTGTPYFGLA